MPQIFQLILRWYLQPQPLLGSLLVALFIVSSLGVAYSSHLTRNSYRDIQALEKGFDDLEHEYEKLLLERSAWADYTRLDQLARDKLAMAAPSAVATVVIR